MSLNNHTSFLLPLSHFFPLCCARAYPEDMKSHLLYFYSNASENIFLFSATSSVAIPENVTTPYVWRLDLAHLKSR